MGLSDLGEHSRSLVRLEGSSSPCPISGGTVSRNYPALPCAVPNLHAHPRRRDVTFQDFLPGRGDLGRVAFVETRDDAAFDPSKVALDAIDQKTLSVQDGGSNGGLPRSDFDREDAAAR